MGVEHGNINVASFNNSSSVHQFVNRFLNTSFERSKQQQHNNKKLLKYISLIVGDSMWYTQVDYKVVELSFIVGEKYNIRICIFAADVARHQW